MGDADYGVWASIKTYAIEEESMRLWGLGVSQVKCLLKVEMYTTYTDVVGSLPCGHDA